MGQVEGMSIHDTQHPPLSVVSTKPSLRAGFAELLEYRELLWMLVIREVKVRYSQTFLGIAWAMAQPLSLMVVFTLFFGRFAKVPSDGLPYPVFYYSALLPWTFFTTCLAFGVPSLVTNSSLVTKVYFPREILPVAAVLSATVDFVAAALAFGVLALIFQVSPTWAWLYLVPIVLLQVALALSVTLVLSAVNVSYRDVRYALPLVTQLWLYATPIIYPLSVVPGDYRRIYLAINPMAPIVEAYRQVLAAGVAPEGHLLMMSAISTLIMLYSGYWYFKRAERKFADVI